MARLVAFKFTPSSVPGLDLSRLFNRRRIVRHPSNNLYRVLLGFWCVTLLFSSAPPVISAETATEVEIAKLRKENEALRAENQRLRRMLVEPPVEKSAPPPVKTEPILPKGPSPSITPLSQAKRYWLSETGKRHNDRCRYFKTKTGAACGPNDGTPCKVCGG